MALTPQSNATLEEIAEVIRSHQSFALCGHVSPDGDCLGSQLALHHALLQLGKESTLLLVSDDPIEARLRFMPGASAFVPASKALEAQQGGTAKPSEVFIGLDVPTRKRIGDAACALLDAAECSITIDHHAEETTMAQQVYVDPDSASASILVWQLVKLLCEKPPLDSAICAYTGLVTDTGCFQYQNTNVAALCAAADLVAYGVKPSDITREVMQSNSLASVRLEGTAAGRMRMLAGGKAALSWVTESDMALYGAGKGDADGVVNMLRSISGVRVACALREQDGCIRGNLRAKDDTDVSIVAREYDGGGHRAAAGFTLECSMDEAVDKLSARLEALFADEDICVAEAFKPASRQDA